MDVKVGVICPHRGDRGRFLEQFKKYMAVQTLQPYKMCYVDYEPESADIDVTQRYRRGCEKMFSLYRGGCHVVLFMEVDDWYHPNYIELMVSEWTKAGRPEIFGIWQTVYYHIFSQQYVVIPHRKRASAMSTMVTRRILEISWPRDNNPYLDMEMWHQIPGKTWLPVSPICIGIKHGIGMVGGGAHEPDSPHYKHLDQGGAWLRAMVGEENFAFYESLRNIEV